jgi:hypothetical protein
MYKYAILIVERRPIVYLKHVEECKLHVWGDRRDLIDVRTQAGNLAHGGRVPMGTGPEWVGYGSTISPIAHAHG